MHFSLSNLNLHQATALIEKHVCEQLGQQRYVWCGLWDVPRHHAILVGKKSTTNDYMNAIRYEQELDSLRKRSNAPRLFCRCQLGVGAAKVR